MINQKWVVIFFFLFLGCKPPTGQVPAYQAEPSSLRLEQGWNGFSVPFENIRVSDAGLTAPLYYFDTVLGEWQSQPTTIKIPPATAFYVYAETGINIPFTASPTRVRMLPLKKGWNFVGMPCLTTLSLNQIYIHESGITLDNAIQRGIISSVYTFGTTMGTTTNIEPGKAYWVEAEEKYTLRFDCPLDQTKLSALQNSLAARSITNYQLYSFADKMIVEYFDAGLDYTDTKLRVDAAYIAAAVVQEFADSISSIEVRHFKNTAPNVKTTIAVDDIIRARTGALSPAEFLGSIVFTPLLATEVLTR